MCLKEGGESFVMRDSCKSKESFVVRQRNFNHDEMKMRGRVVAAQAFDKMKFLLCINETDRTRDGQLCKLESPAVISSRPVLLTEVVRSKFSLKSMLVWH